MEYFEASSFNNFHLKPICWVFFIKNTFVIWPHSWSSIDSFSNHLNNISPHIQFTMKSNETSPLTRHSHYPSTLWLAITPSVSKEN